MAETTECQDTVPPGGWIFYDGDCAICTGLAGRFGGTLRRAGFVLAAFQTPWAAAKLGLQPGEVPNAARAVTASGATFEGADAMLLLADCVWWARPLAWLGRWRPALRAMRRAYAWFAARRHCIGGVCGLPCSTQCNNATSSQQIRGTPPQRAGPVLRTPRARTSLSRPRRIHARPFVRFFDV